MQQEFWIECSVTGAGQSFTGTLADALSVARQIQRRPGWRSVVWLQPENTRVAEVDGTDFEWIAEIALSGVIRL